MNNASLMLTVQNFLSEDEFLYEIKTSLGKIIDKFAKNRVYSIPAYQREIRWAEKNVNILIDDLICGPKFLGTILLNKLSNSNYEIIDGQQRISVFILILKAIEKKISKKFKMCVFENKTYDCLFDVLELGFSETEILSHENKQTYLESDILEQRERFETIWETINKSLEVMIPVNINKLKDNLLNSEINVIFASNTNSKIYVDYYLDLNDKSVKLDNIDILKANLFKIDYETMSEEWANVQKSIKSIRNAGLQNYALETFYYHYFACSANEYLDYKLTELKSNLKFNKSIIINGHTYEPGTNILNAVENQSYFTIAINQLKLFAKFLKDVFNNDGLLDLKAKLKAQHIDNDTIECIFAILSDLIRIDDEVPKMLIMKYFLGALGKDVIVKEDIKLIFYIYIYSILFTLTGNKKESSKLIRIIISKDWGEKLKVATLKMWNDNRDKINYFKKITFNGKVTDRSGQYLPKHIMAIKEFATTGQNTISFNQKKLKEFLTSSSCTAEHFFVNKSHKVSFKYDNGTKDADITLPSSILKYISCPVNYLYLESSANGGIGNMTIYEKIKELQVKGRVAFSSDMSYNYFKELCNIFDWTKVPDLTNCKSKAKAETQVRKYYKEVLSQLMEDYINKIRDL